MASVRIERARPWLGTVVVIRAEAPEDVVEAALEAGFGAIASVHASMSFHECGSELARLNAHAWTLPQAVSPMLSRVLRAALALASASDGRFDPTLGARLVASGHLPRPHGPTPHPEADWRDVCFEPDGRVHFRRPLWLDLGGIAKGHAVDRAVRALRRAGATSGMVNAGGDLRVFGDARETLRVRDPADPVRTHDLAQVRDGAVATSAGYFSTRRGRCALLDGRDGRAADPSRSVSVAAPRAIWADALTKVVLADVEAALPLLRRLRASAACVDAAGNFRVLA